MTIYKIIMHVTEHDRRKGQTRMTDHKEEIVIGKRNFKTAMGVYKSFVMGLKPSFSYSVRGIDRKGIVRLFVPHMFDNGTLAYWPDSEKYIERYEIEA